MERKKRVVPREICVERSERSNHRTRKRGSAERAGVSRGHSKPECEEYKGRRTESIGVLSMTEKGGMTANGRKHKWWLFAER